MPADEHNIQPPHTLGLSVLILACSLSILPSQAALPAEPAEGGPVFMLPPPGSQRCLLPVPDVHGSLQHPSLTPTPGFLAWVTPSPSVPMPHSVLGKGRQGTAEAGLHQPRLMDTESTTSVRAVCCQGL